jgi:hypothetical protein
MVLQAQDQVLAVTRCHVAVMLLLEPKLLNRLGKRPQLLAHVFEFLLQLLDVRLVLLRFPGQRNELLAELE